MKDFDNSLLTLIQGDEANTFWLIDLEVSDSTTLYLSSCDIDLVSGGNTYTPYEFTITPISYDGDLSVDKMNIDMANVDLAFSSHLLNDTVTSRPCCIYLGGLVSMVPVIEPVYQGLVSSWTINEEKAQITISSELVYWNKETLRTCGSLCPWEFKSTECGYSGGETVCNKTYAACKTFSREDYFGGFRFLAALEEKEIWWGRTQK